MSRIAYSINSYTGTAPTALLASGITSSGTVVIISGTTSGWNPLGAAGGFNLALDYGSSAEEKIYAPSGTYTWASGVVTISGVSRGADNTSAIAHSANTVVAFVSTATDFQEANYLVNQVLSKNVIPNSITVSGSVTTSGMVVNTANAGSQAQTLEIYDTTTGSGVYLRANSGGGLNVVNSAFNAPIFNVNNAGIVTFATASASSNIPTLNGINFNNNGYMFSDGNLHITSSGGSIWINANDGSNVEINKQSPATGGLDVGGVITASNISDSGWISVTSFSNSFSATNAVAYRKLNGVLYMRGSVNGGTAGTTAFTLPAGYRPSAAGTYTVQQYGSSGDTYITVNTDGTVVPNASGAWFTGAVVPLG